MKSRVPFAGGFLRPRPPEIPRQRKNEIRFRVITRYHRGIPLFASVFSEGDGINLTSRGMIDGDVARRRRQRWLDY